MTNVIKMSDITEKKTIIHTWEVWLNSVGIVVALSRSGAIKGKKVKVYKFEYNEDEVLFLTNKSHEVYAYTRTKKMVDFMKKFNIDRIKTERHECMTLNVVEYISDEKKKTVEIYTDGTFGGKSVYRKTKSRTYSEKEGRISIDNYTWLIHRKIHNDEVFTILYVREGYDMYELDINTKYPITI